MAKIDRIKAEIAIYEKLLFIFIAALLGIIGWTASTFQTLPSFFVVYSLLGVIGDLLILGGIFWKLKVLLVELENAE